jgi:hypothetical protein
MPDPTCAIAECDRKPHARGWCRSHYGHWRYTGDPLGSPVPDMPPDLPGERWLPVPGWEGYYSVSDMGRVRSEIRTVTYITGETRRYKGAIRRTFLSDKGRHRVSLSRHGRDKTHLVSHLVAAAFLGPRPPGLDVCHGDGNASNDALENLRYDTRRENILDAVQHGTHHQTSKTHCPRDHRLIAPNLVPRCMRQGERRCLACTRTQSYVYWAKRADRPYDFRALADQYYERIMEQAG